MWHFQTGVIAWILLNGKCISSSKGFKIGKAKTNERLGEQQLKLFSN